MRSVVLSVVEGKNFILGTFDTTNYQSWWKSNSFPGSVEIIYKPIHVYGQYHVCIVKMLDGTYSIYRTSNMGKTWESVYNTSDIIYTVVLIDYGWVIASTSSGWIESQIDSGKTWSTISSFAPGCQTVINVGDNILFAHDCNFIWKSEDYARSWSKVLDCHNLTWQGFHGGSMTTKYASYVAPALCGYESRIVVGCGPYLLYSDDLGLTWTMPWEWMGDPAHLQPWLLPLTNRRILQVINTDIRGHGPEEATLMVRVHLIPEGRVRYLVTNENGTRWFNTKFETQYHGDDVGAITAYSVSRVGTTERDILAVITTFDSLNNPIVQHSTNGGWNWIYANTSTATVYQGDPSQEIVSDLGQQVFEEEYIATHTWMGAPCHNYGKWVNDYNKTIRGLSFDVDILDSFRKTVGYTLGYRTYITKETTYDFDIVNQTALAKILSHDICTQNTVDESLLIGRCIQKMFETTYDIDIVNAIRLTSILSQDILSQKTIDNTYTIRMNTLESVDNSFGITMKLIDNHIDEIMTSIARYTPQAPDVRYPNIGYRPYDSRTQRVS